MNNEITQQSIEMVNRVKEYKETLLEAFDPKLTAVRHGHIREGKEEKDRSKHIGEFEVYLSHDNNGDVSSVSFTLTREDDNIIHITKDGDIAIHDNGGYDSAQVSIASLRRALSLSTRIFSKNGF